MGVILKIKFLAHETHETSITIIILFSSLHELHKITIMHVIMKIKPSYIFQQIGLVVWLIKKERLDVASHWILLDFLG